MTSRATTRITMLQLAPVARCERGRIHAICRLCAAIAFQFAEADASRVVVIGEGSQELSLQITCSFIGCVFRGAL